MAAKGCGAAPERKGEVFIWADEHATHCAVLPPSTKRHDPTQHDASSDARKTTALATSAGSAYLPLCADARARTRLAAANPWTRGHGQSNRKRRAKEWSEGRGGEEESERGIESRAKEKSG